jgi:hypothetical chaperone protein
MIAGIDFGTTNSVICLLDADGAAHTLRFDVGGEVFEVFRTVLNFWQQQHGRSITLEHAAGPEAIHTYLEDPLGSRLIMSMKTYLAQRSFTQTRVFGRIYTLEQMVSLFLGHMLRTTAAPIAGRHVVVGRPVRFAGESADDELGERRLRDSFAAAGLGTLSVAFEPEAAGYRFIRTLQAPATVLVGDFGGGTSDFSIFRFDPARTPRVRQLGHGGIGIAGDKFDYRLIDQIVSPMLGKHDSYRIMGKNMPIPISFYRGLAQWHRLSLMRAPRVLNEIEEVARTASRPERLHALLDIINDEAGYDLYRAIAALKATLSQQDAAEFTFQHRGLRVTRRVRRDEFEEWIASDLKALADTIDRLLHQASIPAAAIDHVFLTGGTSFVPAVRRLFETRFGADKLRGGGEFVSVAEGLALIGQDLE